MRIFQSFLLCLFVFATTNWACAQNGPTKPSAVLTWTQSTTPGVTANCVYRGSTSGNYSMPALFCSTAPIVTFTDTTVTRGSTYFYAVTAKLSATESAYSNEVQAVIPTIAPPTGAGAQETKVVRPKISDDAPVLEAKVIWK